MWSLMFVYLPSLYLWWYVCCDLLLIFKIWLVFLLLNSKWPLYILEKIHYQICIMYNIFPVCGLSLNSLINDFPRAHLKILIKYSSSIFSFMEHTFSVIAKNSSPRSNRFLFSSKNCILFNFISVYNLYNIDPFS